MFNSGFGSTVVVLMLAVFDALPPAGVDAAVHSTSENVAEAPAGSVAMVQVIVPVAPGAGVAQLNVGPWSGSRKRTSAGRRSCR